MFLWARGINKKDGVGSSGKFGPGRFLPLADSIDDDVERRRERLRMAREGKIILGRM